MNLFNSMAISGSALTAGRLRLDLIANNLANVNTTRTAQGGPYRRQMAVFAPRGEQVQWMFPGVESNPSFRGKGVRVVSIVQDGAEFKSVYEPGHPDADASGYVAYPNVNVVTEMVDLMAATRAYEANVAAITAAKSMAQSALDIGRT